MTRLEQEKRKKLLLNYILYVKSEDSEMRRLAFENISNMSYDELAQSLQENEETETYCEDEIVCPYCGNRMEDYDSFFIQQGDGEYECDECGKVFNFTVHIEATYSTSRKE